jgi:hypothetical protein
MGGQLKAMRNPEHAEGPAPRQKRNPSSEIYLMATFAAFVFIAVLILGVL